ncbi:transposase domain-containing protein [Streptomyces sp. NPDC048281]|uniref:transposase domain-containing protein n=1 Tax=Streptomyces sp. NPDC048281 TaxID=3154715 RepID=UPI003443F614
MPQNSVSVRSGATTLDVYAPCHLGELTEIIDLGLVDAVLENTGVRQQRQRLLPVRVVVYFVLALAFFERYSSQAVWAKLTAGLCSVPVAHP